MEFRGADFVKKVQIKQEAEELKHRLEELEYESKVRDDIDDEYEDYRNYQKPSSNFEQLDLQDLALDETPVKPKIDKKKYAFLIFFLSIVFVFTVIVIKFFMSYVSQDDELSANKVDEKQIEQKFEQIVAQTKDINSTESNVSEPNTTVVNPPVVEQVVAPVQNTQIQKVETPAPQKTQNKPIEQKIVEQKQPETKKPEQKKEVIVKETKIEVRQPAPKPQKQAEQKAPQRNLKELFGTTPQKQQPVQSTKQSETTNANAKYIQVGSFSKEPDQKLFGQLKAAGYKYKVIETSKGDKTITKVIVGPLNAENATDELRKIKNNIAPSAFITK